MESTASHSNPPHLSLCLILRCIRQWTCILQEDVFVGKKILLRIGVDGINNKNTDNSALKYS